MVVNIHYPKGSKECNPLFKELKGSNSVYLFLQRRLLTYCDARNLIQRKEMLFCISRHFQFSQGLVNVIIRDLEKHKLLKKINRDTYQLINLKKSEPIQKILDNLPEVKVRRGQ